MNTFRISLAVVTAALAPGLALAQITPGNLVLNRVGDGVGPLTNASMAIYLDEITVAGAPVQSIALPTVASGAQWPVTNSGTATSEGGLTQSADGNSLIAVGYGTAPGLGSVVSSASTAVPRVVARIGLDGTIDTSTALTDAYTANNVRSGCSADGTAFWLAGTATATGGVRYATLGASTSIQVGSGVTNIRRVDVFGSQLYSVSASGTFQGVCTVGIGLPTTTGNPITLLPGFPTAAGPSSYDVFVADAQTLYVADDRTNGLGGIQKWTSNGLTWSLAYTLAPASNVGCRGLSGYVDGGIAFLFATTSAASANAVVSVIDLGAGSTFTTVATTGPNTFWRSVRYVRSPASVAHTGTACATSAGTPTLGTLGGDPLVGNASFTLAGGSAPALSFVLYSLKVGTALPFGIPVPGAPACALAFVLPDVLNAQVADLAGVSQQPLPIPALNALAGAQLAAQTFPFDVSLAYSLPIGASDAIDMRIGN